MPKCPSAVYYSAKRSMDKGPSINYVLAKSAIFDPLLVVFLLSKIDNVRPPFPPETT